MFEVECIFRVLCLHTMLEALDWNIAQGRRLIRWNTWFPLQEKRQVTAEFDNL